LWHFRGSDKASFDITTTLPAITHYKTRPRITNMSPGFYFELALTTAELGEKFYRALSRANAAPHDPRTREACTKLFKDYRDALDKQIAYLKTTVPAFDIEETLKTVIEHWVRLDRDIERVSAANFVQLKAAA
jgi:hypothetical protein